MDILRRKAIKLISLALLAGPWVAFSAPTKSPLEELEAASHENKGCPENSDCDAEMGKLLDQWKNLVQRWQSPQGRPRFAQELSLVTRKRGWPTEFYARPAVRSTLGPALHASSCAMHRSKNPTDVLMRGRGFIKGIQDGHALFTKGNAEFRLKIGEAVFLQTAVLHSLTKPPQVYHLPLEERPVYVEGDRLVVLVESEDLYALLNVDPAGDWSFSPVPESGVTQFFNDGEDVSCPKEALPLPTGFSKTYCRRISHKDGTSAGVVQLFWACN